MRSPFAVGSVVLSVLILFATPTYAALSGAQCFKRVEELPQLDSEQLNYGRTSNILNWECYDWSLDTAQQLFQSEMGAKLKFGYDHTSFEQHYAEEAKKTKVYNRDRRTPHDYCYAAAEGAVGSFDQPIALKFNPMLYIAHHPQLKKEFLDGFDSISCEYNDKDAPKLKVEGKTLVFVTKLVGDGPDAKAPDLNEAEFDFQPLLPAILPSFKAVWDSEH